MTHYVSSGTLELYSLIYRHIHLEMAVKQLCVCLHCDSYLTIIQCVLPVPVGRRGICQTYSLSSAGGPVRSGPLHIPKDRESLQEQCSVIIIVVLGLTRRCVCVLWGNCRGWCEGGGCEWLDGVFRGPVGSSFFVDGTTQLPPRARTPTIWASLPSLASPVPRPPPPKDGSFVQPLGPQW